MSRKERMSTGTPCTDEPLISGRRHFGIGLSRYKHRQGEQRIRIEGGICS